MLRSKTELGRKWLRRAPVKAETRAAEDPRPVLWASESATLKSWKRLDGLDLFGVDVSACE